ncbi:hypothetical protein [Manganibacter manganicus]|uniref:Uncharacterized protein n=1 Tax=Manganibacter manganicus TaxID=1873176 RepID=A0A1V8RKE5_9HYPH|nr:hypothetical protein [Pseudaminobacter manganicus]OQM73429.1 hypothetical protein BFN67_09070 [Pseudaminobacter manganicus]
MSRVRTLEADDVPAVAAMFQRLLRKKAPPPPTSLTDYIRRLYLEAPFCGGGVHSLVHENGEGKVSGFIGVHALPMTFNGRKLRAAVCGSLMSEDRERDPLAGARLLKAFLDGPQDLSFSETANETSARLWTRSRGTALTQYSLDWVRVIRPVSFALGVASRRIRIAKVFDPLASVVDNIWRRHLGPGRLSWSALPTSGTGQKAANVREIDSIQFADLLDPLTSQYALRPDWKECRLDWILADAMDKPDLGDLVFCAVSSPTGVRIGAFAYYAKPGGIGSVLQIVAAPGQAGHVIDCLVDDAAARGLGGLRGRVQPALLEAMLGRRIAFVHAASTVVHSRDADLLLATTDSQAFLNGIAGEQWCRLIRGRFT